MKAALKVQAMALTAPVVATDADPVAEAPEHTEAQADALEAKRLEAKAAVAVIEKPKMEVKDDKSYKVKAGDSYWAIAAAHPAGDKTVEQRVKRLQEINDNKSLHPGEVIKLY